MHHLIDSIVVQARHGEVEGVLVLLLVVLVVVLMPMLCVVLRWW